MRALALYLPQFHTFKENDEWWGEGYTEWTAVKRARPLFKGHMQPRVPLDSRYYDLVNDGLQTLKWQADLAKKYGIYGFCIYQYWFSGRQLMERPAEILRDHPEIDINYCICWANESWTRTWYGLESEVLMLQEYGGEPEWRKHFEYLLGFFRDERYIKIDNRPVLMIYRSFDIEKLPEMRALFDKLAREAGFDGVYIISGKTAGEQESREDCIDAKYYFEPGFSLKHDISPVGKFCYNAQVAILSVINRVFKTKHLERRIPIERIYRAIENRDYAEDEFPGVLARWDNTPRRDYKGLLYTGANPASFKRCLETLRVKLEGRKNDFVIINAMNEWGEGAMLEPDEHEGYSYLEAVAEVCHRR